MITTAGIIDDLVKPGTVETIETGAVYMGAVHPSGLKIAVFFQGASTGEATVKKKPTC